MDLQGKRFGSGHRELGGAHDLINQYRLWPFYEFFCKRPLPSSISETHYLHSVVGDTKIMRGEGMELDQLCRNTYVSEKTACLRPFDLDVLSEAFHMREMDPTDTPSAHKGIPAAVAKSENQFRDRERRNRKDKDNDKKGQKYRKHKLQQVKDGSCIDNNVGHQDSQPLQFKSQQDKNRGCHESGSSTVQGGVVPQNYSDQSPDQTVQRDTARGAVPRCTAEDPIAAFICAT